MDTTTTGTNHSQHSAMSTEMQACIANCLDCFAKCDMCAVQCIGMAGMEACVKACLDCATTCPASVRLMSYESPLHGKMCGVCAEACMACAVECEKFPEIEHCRLCAEACRKCEQTCRQMAQMMR